ncbi:MAG: DNA polymerase I [Bacillota bacterium]
MTERVFLLDGHSLVHRAFYALPLLTNSDGDYTNAAYGFARMLFSLIDSEEPDLIAVAFDLEEPTFRHEDYAEYKAGRKKMPDELKPQFDYVRELLRTLHVPIFEKEGYEADDVIGTLAKQAAAQSYNVVIVTGDRDALQLVTEKINVKYTRKGMSDLVNYDLEQIKEDYELEPGQLIDMKGLMGDSSDNIPGVPGIGEKTATKLLHEFGDMETILANIDQVSGKKRKENLSTYKEQARMSKRLGEIDTEVPIEFDEDSFRWGGYDEGEVYELLAEFEFNTLLDRFTSSRKVIDLAELDIICQPDSGQIEEMVNAARANRRLDLTVVLDNYTKPMQSDGVFLAHAGNGKILTIADADILSLQELLEDDKININLLNGKEVLISLRKQGIVLASVDFEPLLARYLLEPSGSLPELAKLLAEELEVEVADDLQEDELLTLALTNLAELELSLTEKLKDKNLAELYHQVELPLLFPLAEMEYNGITLDCDYLNSLAEDWQNRIDKIIEEAYELAGEEFNLNSPKQVGEILFDKLGLPVIKKTKTGYSTSISVLEKLEDKHPIVPLIIEYRHWSKLKSTYLDALPPLVNPDTERIHTSFNQMVTATGRLSSTDPNLQNIPIRSEEGREIRKAFVPGYPDWVLLAADYSQIELRVLAQISQDESLLKTYQEAGDIHRETASKIFEVDPAEVTGNMRRKAKVINFGIAYGMSAYRLADDLDISRPEAEEYIARYFQRFSGVKEYMEDIVGRAQKDGYVTTLLNRRRYIPEINSKNYHTRSFAERTAINTPIQGTAADIMKVAMNQVYQALQEKDFQANLLLQVHDELVLEVPKAELEEVALLVKNQMEAAYELDVPLVADLEAGPNWKDKEEYEVDANA